MRSRWLVLAAWSTALGPAQAADTWRQVTTPHFTVVSNAGEGTARDTAAEFEQVRAAFARIWPSSHLSQGKDTVVLALRNDSSLRRWAPGYFEVKGGIDVVSAWAGGADRQYLLLRTDWRPANPHVSPNYNLYRAYLAVLLSGSFERRLPLWLSNGLSSVLGNTSVHQREILVGRPVPWLLSQFNQNARFPLRTILDARTESPLVRQADQRGQYDAQCYVLAHYLLFGDRGIRSEQLSRFLKLWLAGRSHDQAVVEGLGDLGALETVLVSHARNPILSYAIFPAEAKSEGAGLAARILAPAEVAGLQAAVHVAMGRPVEAQAAVREARNADAQAAISYDAEGLLADRDHDKIAATQAYARAVELGSTSAHSHYRAAQLAWKAEPDAATLLGTRKSLERAIALCPTHANAHSYLAEILTQQGDAAVALPVAERAVALEPGRSYHRVALARVLHKLGRVDEAQRSVEVGLELAEDDADRSNAERFKLYLAQDQGYTRERAQREASQKQTSACQSGDAAACALLLPELERRCDEKQADACAYLSWLYGQGIGLPKDAGKGADYLARACAAGDKPACMEHAWALARGEGVARDEAAGKAALDALCGAAFFPACTRLALLQAKTPGNASRARAKQLLTRACEGGQQDACSMVKQYP